MAAGWAWKRHRSGPSTLAERMVCPPWAAVLGSGTRVDADNRRTTNPLTGEPDAGNPHVRFGGRGEVNPSSLPYLGKAEGHALGGNARARARCEVGSAECGEDSGTPPFSPRPHSALPPLLTPPRPFPALAPSSHCLYKGNPHFTRSHRPFARGAPVPFTFHVSRFTFHASRFTGSHRPLARNHPVPLPQTIPLLPASARPPPAGGRLLVARFIVDRACSPHAVARCSRVIPE